MDKAVRERVGAEQPLYVLDKELLRREQPDVILTQDLCRVCAVPTGHVEQALEELGTVEANVLSLDPQSVDEVIAQIETVGKLVDREDRAAELTGTLRSRVARVKEIAIRLPTVTVFCLEWSEPPFVAGHWMPEMVELAGGVNILNERGHRSVEIAWHEVRDAAPEVVVFMPCGYYLDEAEEEDRRSCTKPSSRTPPPRGTATSSRWTRPRSSPGRGRGSWTGWRSWRGPSTPRPIPNLPPAPSHAPE